MSIEGRLRWLFSSKHYCFSNIQKCNILIICIIFISLFGNFAFLNYKTDLLNKWLYVLWSMVIYINLKQLCLLCIHSSIINNGGNPQDHWVSYTQKWSQWLLHVNFFHHNFLKTQKFSLKFNNRFKLCMAKSWSNITEKQWQPYAA